MAYADEEMHRRTGTTHMENETKNFLDTIKNLDSEDVLNMLYWLDNTLQGKNITAFGYAADTMNMYTTAMQTQSACSLFTDWFAVFDLYEMEKMLGYYSKDGLEWNFCDNLPGTDYYARKVAEDGTITPLTSNEVDLFVDRSDLIFNRGRVMGVTRFSYTNFTCTEDPKRNYTFTENILCDENIQGQGNASIANVD